MPGGWAGGWAGGPCGVVGRVVRAGWLGGWSVPGGGAFAGSNAS